MLQTLTVVIAVLAFASSGCGTEYGTYEVDRVSVDYPRGWVQDGKETGVIAHPSGQDWKVGASIQLRIDDASVRHYRERVANMRKQPQEGVLVDAEIEGARETYAVKGVEDGHSILVYALDRDASSAVLLIASAPENTDLDLDHIVDSLRIKSP